MQHSFEEFSEKRGRVELKSVRKFVAKAVLVESARANQFSLGEVCRTVQLEIFKFSTIPQASSHLIFRPFTQPFLTRNLKADSQPSSRTILFKKMEIADTKFLF